MQLSSLGLNRAITAPGSVQTLIYHPALLIKIERAQMGSSKNSLSTGTPQTDEQLRRGLKCSRLINI